MAARSRQEYFEVSNMGQAPRMLKAEAAHELAFGNHSEGTSMRKGLSERNLVSDVML